MTLTILFLVLAVYFLAYSNGANDNFKGVASLFGSKTADYKTSLLWATVATGAGSIAAVFLAEGLLQRFSGKGLVSDALTTEPAFLLSIALGAGATVIMATLLGFPVLSWSTPRTCMDFRSAQRMSPSAPSSGLGFSPAPPNGRVSALLFLPGS
jgi:phosphate/sulfate permease